MKTKSPSSRRCFTIEIAITVMWAVCSSPAQQEPQGPVLVTNAPAAGTFFLLGANPPLPFPFDPYGGALNVYAYDGVFFVDDSQMLSLSIESGGMMMNSLSFPGPGGGGTNSGSTNLVPCNGPTNFTVAYQYSTNGLSLGSALASNNVAALTIYAPDTDAYDIYATTNLAALALPQLSRTNWVWLLRVTGTPTNFLWTNITPCAAWFQLGTMLDEDGDGLTTAHEKLVTRTNPNMGDTDSDGLGDRDELLQSRNPLVADDPTIKIHITNGLSGVVTRPFIQIQGHSETQLAEITYIVLTNGAVSETGNAWVRDQHYDMASGKFTTNWFQAYDLGLTPGTNRVILRFSNYSNAATAIELEYHLDYSAASNAPAILSQWPTNGAVISGTNFTLRGYVDDPTASIHATITAANGTLTDIDADMERDGLFWVDDLPLTNGTSTVILALTNAAGLGRSESFTVTKSSVQLTISSIEDVGAAYPVTRVTGTIDTSGYTVWVNGVKATNTSATSWSAAKVPVTAGGTATFHVTAIPNSDNGGNGSTNGVPPGAANNVQSPNPNSSLAVQLSGDVEKAPEVYVQRYDMRDEIVFSPPGGCLTNENLMNTTYITEWTHGIWGKESGTWHTWSCESVLDSESELEWNAFGESRYRDRFIGDAWGEWLDNNDANWLPGPPSNDREHCDAVYSYSVGDGVTRTHTRKGATRIELFTGGRAGIKRQNIFTLAPSATEMDENGSIVREIPKDKIKLLGKQSADGKLYFVFPDNTTVNVTPEVMTNAPRYFFNVEKTKHKLGILANGIPCDDWSLVKPNFIVGQNVAFSTWWDNPLSGIAGETNQWSLSGTYVNDKTNAVPGGSPPTSSDNYFVNPKLLTHAVITNTWWISGGSSAPENYPVTLEKGIAFTNGQSLVIDQKGSINMFRPLPNFTAQPRDSVRVGAGFGVDGVPQPGHRLQFGANTNPATAGIAFGYTGAPTEPYATNTYGSYALCQVIESWSQQYNWTNGGVCEGYQFHGAQSLDHNFPSLGPASDASSSPTNSWTDSPGTPLGIASWLSHANSFSTFLMFQPRIGGIYVPMYKMTWNWSGSATNYPWGKQAGSYSIGTPVVTTEFPYWTNKIDSFDTSPTNSARTNCF
jgi:hypothetical protein